MKAIQQEIERLELGMIELTTKKEQYSSEDYLDPHYSKQDCDRLAKRLTIKINKVSNLIKELNKVLAIYKNL